MRNSFRSLGRGMLLAAAVSFCWAGSASADSRHAPGPKGHRGEQGAWHKGNSGHQGNSGQHGDSHRAPRVVMGKDGYGSVNMGRNCQVFYDARGNMTSHKGNCSSRELRNAGSAWTSRPGRNSGHQWSSHREPRAVVGRDGYGYVDMGGGCRVFFDASGSQTSNQGNCSGREMRNASAAWATSGRGHRR